MEKIKRVVRNIAETNSSSSHSVVIDTRNIEHITPDSRHWDIPIDSDGYIHVSGLIEFTTEHVAFNSAMKKLQYVCGLICGRCMKEADSHRELKKLEKILTDFTGCRGVIYEWIIPYYKTLLIEGGEPGPLSPTIDHQSMHLDEEVLENEESIREFIFNKNSWLIIDSDGSVELPKVPGLSDPLKPVGYVRFFIPDPIGPIDLEIHKYPIDVEENLFNQYLTPKGQEEEILCHVFIDPKTGRSEWGQNLSIEQQDNEYLSMYYESIDTEERTIKWIRNRDAREQLEQLKAVDFSKIFSISIPYTIVTYEFGRV